MLTGLLFSKAYCQLAKAMAGTMAHMKDTNKAGFAPTDYVVHWCAIGHCVGIVDAHEVFQTRDLPPPTPPHPTPPHPVQPHPTA